MGARTIAPGNSFPLGATIYPDGVNFSLYSKHSTLVEVLLFDRVDDAKPSMVIPLDPWRNRTYHYWHVFVPGLQSGQIYGYRVNGPEEPSRGLRFDAQKLLLDPYGRGVVGRRIPAGGSGVCVRLVAHALPPGSLHGEE